MQRNGSQLNFALKPGIVLLLLLSLAVAAAAQETASSAESLARLLLGNERFVSGKAQPKDYLAERSQLTQAERPYAIILACADSRVPPELLFDESLGRLFVVRTAGHVVAPVALGSIEHAVEHLYVKLLFVLGHENCSAVSTTISGGPVPPNTHTLLRRIKPAVDKAYMQGVPAQQFLPSAIRENVRYQMQQAMFESEALSDAVFAKKLDIVGGVYNLQTGRVELVVTDVAISRAESNLAQENKPNQTAPAEASTAPHHATPAETPKEEKHEEPNDVHEKDQKSNKAKEKDQPGAPAHAQVRFAENLRLAYEKQTPLMVKKTMLMRNEKDSCATENCRSIAAGERVSLANPAILSILGRPQIKVRYQGRSCYILADPEAIEVLVR
jgi:carbonic anhydrase